MIEGRKPIQLPNIDVLTSLLSFQQLLLHDNHQTDQSDTDQLPKPNFSLPAYKKEKAIYICGSHKWAVVHNNLQEHMLQRLFVLDHYMPMERQLRQMFWRVFQLCQRWPEATWKTSVLNSTFEIPLRVKSSHATFGEAHKAFIDQSHQQQVLSAA